MIDLRRPPFIGKDIIKKLRSVPESERGKLVIKTRSLASVILPGWSGMKFLLYNGKDYSRQLIIRDEYVGHKLGEFVITRKPVVHPEKKVEKKPAKGVKK